MLKTNAGAIIGNVPAVLIRLPRVCELTGLGRSAIYARMRDRTFPQNVKLGPKASAWVEHEILQWNAERVAERDSRLAESDHAIRQEA